MGGQPLNHKPLQEIADEHDLAIVEDAACSTNASFKERPVGSQFDASVFSFHPRKLLTTGEGGVMLEKVDDIIGRRQEIAVRCDKLIAEIDGVTASTVIDGGVHNYQCSVCISKQEIPRFGTI
mgnify:CR=1 FL=1